MRRQTDYRDKSQTQTAICKHAIVGPKSMSWDCLDSWTLVNNYYLQLKTFMYEAVIYVCKLVDIFCCMYMYCYIWKSESTCDTSRSDTISNLHSSQLNRRFSSVCNCKRDTDFLLWNAIIETLVNCLELRSLHFTCVSETHLLSEKPKPSL